MTDLLQFSISEGEKYDATLLRLRLFWVYQGSSNNIVDSGVIFQSR